MSWAWAAPLREAAERVARRHGVAVVVDDGWASRGHGSTQGQLLGVMWHDTITPYSWSDTQLQRLLVQGYEALPGPIANVGIGSTGNIILVAAGRAYHAGSGSWPGVPSGNLNTVGIEVQHPGRPNPWRQKQLEVVFDFTCELLRLQGVSPGQVLGHKEWAPSRKQDPWSIDMPVQRAALRAALNEKNEKDDDMPTLDEVRAVVREELQRERPNVASRVWAHIIGQEKWTAQKWLADTYRLLPTRVWTHRFGPEDHTAQHWVARGTRQAEALEAAIRKLEHVEHVGVDPKQIAREVRAELARALEEVQ